MRSHPRRWLTALVAGAAVLAAAGSAVADPPARVARISYLKGSVSLRPSTLEDWGAASLNYPVTTGDQLWTDADSWAELHIGPTAIRLAPRTAFAFLDLGDQMAQVRLSEGALDVTVREMTGSDAFEIDTPWGAVTLAQAGVYRVDVLPDQNCTRVIARSGMARVANDGPDVLVYGGQEATLSGPGGTTHALGRAAGPDNWERWCFSRDQRDESATSVRYVSSDMTGYEDLDEYGTWSSEPDYGWVWQPRVVAAGWAPYRDGCWRWVEPWGWTWIGAEPWGFAPFHYGRWLRLHERWSWVPGARIVRPVYAPALVAFIGGEHWRLSFNLGFLDPVAWVALAPGEFWMPRYHASYAYIRNLNGASVRGAAFFDVAHYDMARATFVNRGIGGAATAMERDAFLSGRAVARASAALERRAAMSGEIVGAGAPLAPRADSLVARRGAVARPSEATMERSVVAHTAPPAAAVPFQARERALQASAGRPLDDATLGRLRDNGQVRGTGTAVRMAGGRGVTGSSGGALATPGSGAAASSFGDRPGVERGVQHFGGSNATASSPSSGIRSNDRPSWASPRGSSPEAVSPRSNGIVSSPWSGVRSNDRPSWASPRGTSPGGASLDRWSQPDSVNRPVNRQGWSNESGASGASAQQGRIERPATTFERFSGGSGRSSGGVSSGSIERSSRGFERPSQESRPSGAVAPRSGGGDRRPAASQPRGQQPSGHAAAQSAHQRPKGGDK